MDCAGALLNITAGSGDPVILQISPAAFHGVTENPSAMLMAAQHAALFHPQHIGIHIAAHVERQVANKCGVPFERNPGRLFF